MSGIQINENVCVWKRIKTRQYLRSQLHLYRDIWVEVLADAIENSCRLQRGLKLHIGSEGMHTPTGKQFSTSE